MTITKTVSNQFFNLDLETQKELVRAYNRRDMILTRMEAYKREAELLNEELEDIRKTCSHVLVKENKQWNQDEYGKMLDSGWTDYICPDCGARWSEEFNNG